MVRVLIFGDSITQGYWDLQGGWAQRLRSFIDKRNLSDNGSYDYFFVYNLGISGNTSEDLLRRFEFEAKQRIGEGDDVVLIFSTGGNDSAYVHSKKGNWVSLEKYKENVQKLIVLARKFSSKIIFLSLLPVEQDLVDPMPWDKGKSQKNEYIQKYNETLKSVCKKNNVYFIDVNYHRLKSVACN